jgi:hypothetical protein
MTSLLQRAEQFDKYITQIYNNPINKKSRELCSYAAWHDQTDAVIIEKDFDLDKKGVKVVMLNPSADGGMPHTRPTNIICLPAYSRESEHRLRETIRHELVHIDQRVRPEVWKARLLEEGWLPDASKDVPEELANRCRLNPDTLQCRFPAWEGRYVPLPLFERADKPNLKEVAIRWWDIGRERLRTDPPTTYIKTYGNQSVSSMEHPFELWAYKNN